MRYGALALSFLYFALAAGASAQGAPDLPQGPGRITGQVVHAATGNPVADVEVALYALTADGVPGLRRATSDADGRFDFPGISNAADISYLLGGRYSGVPFPGARVRFAPGETEVSADVRLTDLTDDPTAIRPNGVELRVMRDAQGLRVLEGVKLINAGTTTYVVPPADQARAVPAFSATLPSDAFAFQMPLGVVPDGIRRDGDGIEYYGPIYPGPHDLSWSFSIPGTTDDEGRQRFLLEGAVPNGTPLVLLVPEGLGPIVASGFRRDDEPTIVDGRPHTRLSSESGSFRIEIAPPPARIDPDATRITEIQTVIDADDAALAVRETVTVEVSGDSVVLGTEASPLVRLPFPEEARDVQFGTDAGGVRLTPHPEGGLAAIGTAGPGSWHIEVRYQLPVETLPIRFERHYAERIPDLSIFIADTGEWVPKSQRLHKRRPARTPDLAYMHLQAFEVEPHETVALSLERLPPRSRNERTIGLALAGVLALAAIFWLSVPLRRSGAIDEDEESISALAREREALIWSIRDLDHDFETGKISEEDHREMRDSLRSRAVALLRQDRAESSTSGSQGAVPAEPAEEAPSACTGCGAGLERSHRFCPQCGSARPEAEGDSPS